MAPQTIPSIFYAELDLVRRPAAATVCTCLVTAQLWPHVSRTWSGGVRWVVQVTMST
jgi:hypothetical protein